MLLQLQLYMATNMRREAESAPRDRGRATATGGLYEADRLRRPDAVLAALERHGARTYLAPELGRRRP